MNIKKIQGRIPMNYKKIIPLTFAALSVAGAFSACSDHKISGADEQVNTMAQNPNNDVYIPEAILTQLRSVSLGTAITVGRLAGENESFEDTVNAHETYDNIIQSIFNNDVVREADSIDHSFDCLVENNVNDECLHNYIAYVTEQEKKYQTMVVMKNEEGLIHGPIYFDGYKSHHKVYCEKQMKDLAQKGGGAQSEFYHVGIQITDDGKSNVYKELLVSDTSVREQFKQECTLENGVYEESFSGYASSGYSGDSLDYVVPLTYFPIWSCRQIPVTPSDGVAIYKDSYWEKYVKLVVENCTTQQDVI
jgi:hypothetical protein